VTTFASNAARLQTIGRVASEAGRRVCIAGRSLDRILRVAQSTGYLRDFPPPISFDEAMRLPKQEVLIIATGGQGEPRAALGRIAGGTHELKLGEGDTVIFSSRIIPGNEKAIFRMIDHMSKRGADVLYGSMNPPLHVSGHGSIEEMKLVLNLVRPRYFMPIHGEFRQLSKHARLADHLKFAGLEEAFVMESGDVLEIDHHGARKAGKVPVGRVCIDSGSVDDVVQEMVIRDRRHLSEDGIVLPIIAINRQTGKMENAPEIVSRGFAVGEGPEFAELARAIVAKTMEGSNQEEISDWGVIKEKIRADLKRHIVKQTQRRPLIMPVILEV
jgi:ribonuclease J